MEGVEDGRRTSRRTFLAGLAAGAVGAAIPVTLLEGTAAALEITRRTIRLDGWPHDGFRAAVLGDFHGHLPPRALFAERAVRAAIAERPDVIAVVGDWMSMITPRNMDAFRPVLHALEDADCPVVGVLGNHDYWSGEVLRLIGEIEKTRIRLLRNSGTEVQGVPIFGVDDVLAKAWDPEAHARADLGEGGIVLLHEPDPIDDLAPKAGITLSGHTHGGQICLPTGRPLQLPGMGRRYPYGFYPDAPTPLFVTRGVGTTGPAWRLFCRPEVAILTLRPA